jgi:predicted dinucleotide-binding enzyme
MKIGIIGAGFVSQGVAKLCLSHGHEVMLSNSRGPDSLVDLAQQLGCVTGTPEQAAEFGQIVLLAIPFKACQTLPPALLKDKIVIDANNYYPNRDGAFAVLDQYSTTTSELIAAHLPHSTIVKAFSSILARELVDDARPAGTPGRRALPIAGNDQAANDVVARLIEQIGYDVVDTGALAESWRFERGMPCYCQRLDRAELKLALAQAKRGVETGYNARHQLPASTPQ